ncbi:ER membrane protein complex subunit 5-like isoform X2 [Crassostrea virginica]|uniref:Membrane magnesium transporter 1-like isoform X2 n=1 Tax=Crassostrea virginica TaxID=6565 RepID=A0A8B8EEK7_CRAVI|nr:membrane magnesium transporter 1-like isoform X2 [Crassostrea virginica]XP_022338114.1 membrane magnesium transporter 1-like isoform X2 [Crassostrea virginica]
MRIFWSCCYVTCRLLCDTTTYLRLTEQEFTTLPVDIIVQCFVGLLLTCYGVVHVAGSFREICASAELESKTWDMLGNRQAFYSFCHRGMAINYRKEDDEEDS